MTSPVRDGEDAHGNHDGVPSVFDNTQVAMVTSDLDGRLLKVNRAMSDLLGYEADELTARTWTDLTHPDDLDESLRLVRACLDGEVTGFSLDMRYLHADGRAVTVSLTTSLVRGGDGGPAHFSTQMTDIAKGRALADQLRGQQHQYARLLEGLGELGEGVVVYDGGRIVYANDALCTMTGYDLGGLLAMDEVDELVASEEAEGGRDLGGGDHLSRGTMALRRRDGSEIAAEFATVDIRLDGHEGRLSVVRDLSDRLRVNLELQAANQLKTDLLAMLSHDIAQPLTAIRGYAQLLVDKWVELTDEARLNLVRRSRANAERLGEMVAQILAMGQAEGSELETKPESVPLAATIATVMASLSDAAPGVSAHEVNARAVLVDPGHLQQILMNLVGNAGKYGRPPIEVSAHELGDGQVELRVRDHGPGVPANFVPHLFERYTRAGNEDSPGTGLGLFIVQRLAEANGGTISYDAGAGATFVLRLPVADWDRDTASDPPAPRG